MLPLADLDCLEAWEREISDHLQRPIFDTAAEPGPSFTSTGLAIYELLNLGSIRLLASTADPGEGNGMNAYPLPENVEYSIKPPASTRYKRFHVADAPW